MDFTTKVLHNPYAKEDAYGALRFPTYSNASFEFDSAEDIENAFVGKKMHIHIHDLPILRLTILKKQLHR